jgi:16S rRNA (adenine1518-N6/adenine1519-N6)-dimethyltransferase
VPRKSGASRGRRSSRGYDDARPKRPRAKKRFSQNFLVDGNMARKIVDLCQIRPEDSVIEIGSGTGALTRPLLERATSVHAVEVDRELFEHLRVEMASEPGLTLHNQDILKLRVRDLVPEGRAVVVGNLPYAITTDLVFWLLEQHAEIRRAVVLMQREVALRMTAQPGMRVAGSVTLAVSYRAEAERILDVPPGCFRPVPRVTSSLVAFRFRDEPAVSPLDETVFFRVIRAGFGERRKTLANALAAGLAEPRPVLEELIVAAGLDPRVRGERLTLEEFRRLADLLVERRLAQSEGPEPEATGPGSSSENDSV